MTDLSFLDTNILLRHLRGDHPDHSPRATALIAAIEQGQETVRTADTVVFETVFTLERTYRRPRNEIVGNLLPILELPGVMLPGKRWLRQVFALYVQEPTLSFADCYHAIFMRRHGLATIYSFDQDFDRLPGIRRREPELPTGEAEAH